MSDKLKIQKAMIALARAGEFYQVDYDEQGAPIDFARDTEDNIPIGTPIGTRISPGSVGCNEVSSRFAPDTRQGRRVATKASEWLFELVLAFDKEALLEWFEKSINQNVPIVRLDNGTSALLRLRQKTVRHPIRQQSSGGTQVTYTVLADCGHT